ncbi:hypothetical protein OAP63_17035 [Vibrio sp.]|nr:hypothetical protein [Vibrio sp.]
MLEKKMIVWGTKSKIISGPEISNIQCPSCDSTKFNSFGILKYLHVYWIPFVAKGKVPGIECQHCKKSLIGNELEPELANEIKKNVFTKKSVASRYIGLVLVLAILCAGAVSGYQHSQDEISYISQPMIHDVYVVDMTKIYDNADPEYKYGAMRIQSIDGQNITMQVSNLIYTRSKGVKKDIRKGKTASDSYYDTNTDTFTLQELQNLKDKGVIDYIDRD